MRLSWLMLGLRFHRNLGGYFVDEVHAWRTAHTSQVVLSKRMRMTA